MNCDQSLIWLSTNHPHWQFFRLLLLAEFSPLLPFCLWNIVWLSVRSFFCACSGIGELKALLNKCSLFVSPWLKSVFSLSVMLWYLKRNEGKLGQRENSYISRPKRVNWVKWFQRAIPVSTKKTRSSMTILTLATLSFLPNPSLSPLLKNVYKTKHKLCFVLAINVSLKH